MYFLLSPAKSLNETDAVPVNVGNYYSQPEFIEHAQALMKILKTKEPADLQELMGISDDLAQLNATRNQNWQWSEDKPFSLDSKQAPAKPAGYLFDGDVYTGLDMYGMDKDSVIYANEHVGILSGLYGVLKPLDLMLPYRLEMGTKLKNKQGDDLYAFWGELITTVINERLQAQSGKDNEGVVVNLASNEYFKAVKKKSLNAKLITPRFEDEKNGKYKVISFYAKKARGLMVRYACKNQLSNVEDLKQFDLDGYVYCMEASDEKTWVYRRGEQKG